LAKLNEINQILAGIEEEGLYFKVRLGNARFRTYSSHPHLHLDDAKSSPGQNLPNSYKEALEPAWGFQM